MISNLFMASAYAQNSSASAGAGSTLMSFAPMILIGLVFYFLMIRPQNKKLQQEKEYISSLKKGDEVYTKSGLIGKIYGLTEKVVTLELDGGAKVKILRGTVAGPFATLIENSAEKK